MEQIPFHGLLFFILSGIPEEGDFWNIFRFFTRKHCFSEGVRVYNGLKIQRGAVYGIIITNLNQCENTEKNR